VGKLTDRLDRPIVLVGLMGAGKSTVGRRLAKRLGLPFIDTDAAIADAAGYSAAEIFDRYGEADFRDGERRLVARLIDDEVKVIATGGGVFVDPRTRKLLNERAITVWLDAPVDVLADRTARRDTRPLLRNDDPKGTLERLAKDRGPLTRRRTSGSPAARERITTSSNRSSARSTRTSAAARQSLRPDSSLRPEASGRQRNCDRTWRGDRR
jgi:shikimate kinase